MTARQSYIITSLNMYLVTGYANYILNVVLITVPCKIVTGTAKENNNIASV